jgi:formylglycine-generating enzyme required for sulfatase activity
MDLRRGEPFMHPDDRAIDTFIITLPEDGGDLELAWIPPGEFTMGSDDGSEDEKPQHAHPVPEGYLIARHQTTWRQYLAFCRAANHPLPQRPLWARDEHPVVNVTWDDASAFAAWLGLALPTEAQWEKAARGPDGRRYAWGEAVPTGDRVVNLESRRYGGQSTAPVGAHPRGLSYFGLHDMGGNVREWTADLYDGTAYERWARGDLSPPAGEIEDRACRGNGWKHPGRASRATIRMPNRPTEKNEVLGFRVAKTGAPEPS